MGGTSVPNTTNPSSEDPPSSRSFFPRLSFLSRSRTRNIADFHIRPAEPHRKYSAGDHVEGAVVLTVLKSVRITHLTATLHGFVKVHKGPAAGQDSSPANPTQALSGAGAGRIQYFGNGHASLFQDEQVLSADGKLEPGRYEFNFDLVFPSEGLPSSIDFERGTISYMITATLTRPTAMAPVTSCDRKIYLVEKVDIGALSPPRPRTISLEPISRRSKRKRPAAPDRASTLSDAQEPSDLDSFRTPESVTEVSVAASDEAGHEPSQHHSPRSPTRTEFGDVMSEFSTESGLSGSVSGAGGNRTSDAAGSSSSTSQTGSRTPTAEEKTITASVEMLKGGCLPGDFVPVKISVHHIKRIKSVHGVIVTLYRQGRIDSAPPLRLFSDVLSKEDMRRLEKEEYFPKSKTGLSGLSLSSAGSCSVFRKDLSQAFGPLIIDPVTLDASVTVSVRLPEDAFPTIKGVPGELISFKYQLEVIVDLGGKLASQSQSGHAKAGALSGHVGPASLTRNPYADGSGALGAWGGSIIDTDQLRRQKGVISVVFEVPVGTLDSSRQRTREARRANPPDDGGTTGQHSQHQPPELPPTTAIVHFQDEKRRNQDDFDPGYDDREANDQYPPLIHEYPPSPYYAAHEPPPQLVPSYEPPPPVMEDESALSEKERIRRAEQRLLPSQPSAPSSSTAAGPSSASRPRADEEEEDIYTAEDLQHPPYRPSQTLPPSTSTPRSNAADQTPTAPALEDVDSSEWTPGPPHAGEDKLERERRRLLTEASAPPDFPDDSYDIGIGSSNPGPASSSTNPAMAPPPPPLHEDFAPSAPVLLEEQEDAGQYGQHAYSIPHVGPASHHPSEPLPKYVR